VRDAIILLGLLLVFAIQCVCFDFTQDDAFISFRYMENFLSGHGLVFNPGERVEGYTNFLWILLLSLLVKCGTGVIAASKVLGITSGAGVIVLLYLISLKHLGKKYAFFALLPPAFLVANSSFAYWSVSGLETSFFALGILLSIRSYPYSRRLAVLLVAISSLIRPEGILVFLIFTLYQIVEEREALRKWSLLLVEYLVLLLPYVLFKYVYYDSLLPNTFYAKAGISAEHLVSGLEYFWRFLKDYGFLGLVYLVPICLYRRWARPLRLLVWIVCGYTLYVIVIGGDVLKAHRFFTPLLAFLYLLLGLGVRLLWTKIGAKALLKRALTLLIVLGLGVTLLLPRGSLLKARRAEMRLVRKMGFIGEKLKADFASDMTLAASTIGAISYFSGVNVIDMLGLTDRRVARHSEEVEGFRHSWKERKYNATYVLSRDPDFIIFSTAHKPSAPAERALFLHSKFRENYYLFYLPFQKREFEPVFRRKGEYEEEDFIAEDPEFVNLYSEAVHQRIQGDYWGSIRKLKEVVRIAPEDFATPYEEIGLNFLYLKDDRNALEYLKRATSIDSCCVRAHRNLAYIYYERKRYEELRETLEQLGRCNPEFMPVAGILPEDL
jgi:tetratricopeptide (TPR) repeat protein